MSDAPDPTSDAQLPPEFQRWVDRVGSRQRETAQKSLGKLHTLGLTSFEQLAAALPTLQDEALVTGIWALPYFDKRRTVPLAKRLLSSSDPTVRVYALAGLEMIGGPGTVPVFLHHLHDADPAVREKAAHGLGFLFDSRYDDLVFEPLLAVLENDEEAVAVRAQAAESLGNILAGHRRTQRFRRAEQALLCALDHSDPTMRFWAAFALGSMRSRAALPRLRHLAETDAAVCPMWWTVQEEASDAIQAILTGGWPDHDRQRHW